MDQLLMRSLVFVALEQEAINLGKRSPPIETRELTKYLKIEHKRTMQLLHKLQSSGMLVIRQRQSGGILGNGFDGALYAEILLMEAGRKSANKYLMR